MELLILAGVFFGTLLLLVGVYAFVNRRQLAAAESARERLRAGLDPTGKGPISILRDDRSSQIPFLQRLLAGRALTYQISVELTRAGSRRLVGEFILTSLASAAIGLAVGQSFANSALVAFALASIGLFLPYVLLKRQQRRRLAKFEEQLPDALDMLVNALRAGYSLPAGMDFVGKEMPEPLGPELARCHDEQRLGVEMRDALINLQERVETTDVKMFVTCLLIQRETGGNLGEILTNLSNLIRQRQAFRGEVATLTAEPKLSARVLAALPIVAFLMINFLNPDLTRALYETQVGKYLVIYAATSVIVGYMIMMKIADVEY